METMTVVFFYVSSHASGRKKRKWCYDVRRENTIEENIVFSRIQVFLPLFEKGKKRWTGKALSTYLDGLDIPQESRNVYYVPDEEAACMLERGTEPLSLEWILFLLAYYHLDFDGLLILQDREMDAEEMIRHFAPVTKYLGVITKQPEKWQDVAEELSEEYGFLLDVVTEFGGHHYRGEKLLVVAGRENYQVSPDLIPEGSMWLSTDIGSENRKICAGAHKVAYFDIKRFLRERNWYKWIKKSDTLLDTDLKIQYNNTR
ncbi:MAG: hypothetical protein E7293_04870 [Lachnospiraceae bacterium]|nr:hypothetical protein [Lachnospiraceae bacterium]